MSIQRDVVADAARALAQQVVGERQRALAAVGVAEVGHDAQVGDERRAVAGRAERAGVDHALQDRVGLVEAAEHEQLAPADGCPTSAPPTPGA